MRIRKVKLALATLLVCVLAMAGGTAYANGEITHGVSVNSPTDYCGTTWIQAVNDGHNYNPERVFGWASASVRENVSSCTDTTGGDEPALPADYLRVQFTIRCSINASTSNEWVAYTSGTNSNPAGQGHINNSSGAYANWCNAGPGQLIYMRVVTTTQFYTWPGVWQVFLNTSHWMNKGV